MSRHKYLAGHRFGSLVALGSSHSESGSAYILCQCDCGSDPRQFRLSHLVSKATVRCSDRAFHPDPRFKGQDIGYWGAHNRVKGTRGSASLYPCAQCGKQAAQWAYDHGDGTGEKREGKGREAGCAYSTDPAHYFALCKLHHARFDKARARLPRILSPLQRLFWMIRNPDVPIDEIDQA